eukprot:COSAG01_NODE_46273_length_401_cov_1.764901_1_plen_76_part_01
MWPLIAWWAWGLLHSIRQVLAAGASWLGEALPQKLAIVIGTESTGVSRFILDNCDRRVYLPQNGAGSDIYDAGRFL